MTNFIIDVESDGPAPGTELWSMNSFGLVEVTEEGAGRSFHGLLAPISDNWIPESLAIGGYTREECLTFPNASETMIRSHEWLASFETDNITFWSDNIAYDWLFWAWYSWNFCNANPAGYSARRISDFYCGIKRNSRAGWKHLRTTKHTHNPVDDATGNAEALHAMIIDNDVRFKW